MKKVLFSILALVLALGLAVPMAAPAVAHTETEPFTRDLIAGGGNPKSAMDVGDVLVWNDGDNLYVKYETTGDWVMTETHLAVVDDQADFSTTKDGNPKVGHFPDGDDYDPPVSEDTFTFNLEAEGWEPCTDLYIAAHAVVVDTSSMETMTIVSDTSVDVYGPLDHYAGLGHLDWGTSNKAAATWVHSSWPSIGSATWISTAYYVEDVVNDSWRYFHQKITIPGYPSGGMVRATADNAEEFYFNSSLIGSDGEVQVAYYDNGEWGTIISYPITPQPGVNSLDFIVRNYAANYPNIGGGYIGGTPPDPELNPAGLIYEAEFTYYLEETAWGDGERFVVRGNWATYFTYHVQGLEGLVGDWQLDFDFGGIWSHDMTITSQSGGTLSGTGGYPVSGSYTHPWTMTGTVSGSSVLMTIVYGSGAPNPGYTVWALGTVATDLQSMSGTCTTSIGQSGTWTATRGP